MPNNSLIQQLTDSVSIEIITADGSSSIKDRIWAINWFNYKRKWLYSLYNKLASKYVVQVGGELLFKGHHIKTILGEEKHKRQTLLIVTYPRVYDFLNMLMIKAFQVVSLLRVKAVMDFVFGFTKRVDEFDDTKTPPLSEESNYLVYHYQGKANSGRLLEIATQQGLTIYFVGEKLAQIKRMEKGKGDVLAPFFMDGIAIFESRKVELLEAFINSEGFRVLAKDNTSNYAAIFARIK